MSIKLELPVLNECESYTGETLRIPRLEVPSIRVSYKSEDDETKVCPKGEFIQYNPATKEIMIINQNISLLIIGSFLFTGFRRSKSASFGSIAKAI